MRTSVVFCAVSLTLVAASPAPQVSSSPQPTVIAAPGTLGLGAVCSSNEQCANGADCYGVSSFTIKTCGSFQSSCKNNNQCATNNCNQGFCNGYIPPESYRITQTSTTTPNPTPVPTSSFPVQPSVTAAPATLGLGAICSTNEQCANGAACYGVTSFTIKTCGSFQAVCQRDDQCATNNCNQGFCNGYLVSESYRITKTSTSASSIITYSSVPTSVITTTKYGNYSTTASCTVAACKPTQTLPITTTTTTTPPKFTGAASKMMGGSCFAIVGVLAALAL